MNITKAAFLAAISWTLIATGADIPVTGDKQDWTIGLNASLIPTKISNTAAATLSVCDDNSPFNQMNCAAILVFQLPDLGGEAIASAKLAIYWDADNMVNTYAGSTDTTMPKWCDLYAIRYSNTNIVQTTDYGYKTTVGANDALIQQQFLYQAANVSMNPELKETDAAADTALAAWLTAQYSAGAVAGDYVFLRVHGMKDTANPWKISAAEDTTGKAPVLTITTGQPALAAVFSANPSSGVAPLDVTFTDQSLGNPTGWFWDFGDGETTNAASAAMSHIYQAAGAYTVTLTVTNATETSSVTWTNLINVSDLMIPTSSFSISGLAAGRVPVTITFVDTSTGSITNRHWDFGDGESADTVATAMQHVYTNSGDYTVALTCSGPVGENTATKTDLVHAIAALPPNMIELFSKTADTSVGLNAAGQPGVRSTTATALYAGDDNVANNASNSCGIVVFQLPDLGGKTITDANLSVEIYCGYPSAFSPASYPIGLDLYGVRHDITNTVLASDHGFNGSGSGTLIQNDFSTFPSNIVYAWEVKETDAVADAELASWLTAQYNDGAQPGDYVFLRFEVDNLISNAVNIASAEATSQIKPTLLLTLSDINMDPPPASTIIAGPLGGGQDVIHWTTAQGSGFVYSVWYSTNLLNGFQPLATDLGDTVTSITNTIGASPIFYQIRAQ